MPTPTQALAQPVAVPPRRGTSTGQATSAPPQARRTNRPKPGRGAGNGLVWLLVAMAAVLLALGAGFYGLATLNREGVVPTDPTPAPTNPPTAQPTAPPKPVVVPTNTAVAPTPSPAPQPTETPVPDPSPSPVPPSPSPLPPSPSPSPVPPSPIPRVITVPQLRGQTLDQAQSALAQAGLTMTVRGVNANADKNVVVDQSPAAGATLPPGGTVALQVGTGVDDDPRREQPAARPGGQTLQNDGFRVRERDARDQRTPAGLAIGTNPQAGVVLQRNSEVELDVSTGRGN